MDEQKKMEDHVNNPIQDELDLEFNHLEPITPKKTMSQTTSFRKKAISLISSFRNKVHAQQDLAVEEIKDASAENDVMPADAPSLKELICRNLNKPEHWKFLGFIPQKYRRLFIVLLLAVIILLIVAGLKPSVDTVNTFEQSDNHIPTQFQSLNQEQPLEKNVLDHLEKGEDAQALQQAELSNARDEELSQLIDSIEKKQVRTEGEAKRLAQVTTKGEISVESEQNLSKSLRIERSSKAETTPINPKENKILDSQPKEKNKLQAMTEKKAPVVEAKPIASNKSKNAYQTLNIPQGTTLMQVFRNNKLNISDVNAMTKAPGANGVLGRFKPNDKVQVMLNSQGRVEELRLSNGSYFIRQANGTYKYNK